MSYSLALVLAAVAAGVVAIVRSKRPHPRHKFIFQMLASLDAADEAADAVADPHRSQAAERRTV